MSLFDTIDGSFMNFAYGWAFSRPARKLFYNLTVTVLSIVVALVIGTVELLAVVAERFGLTGAVWDFATSVDLNVVGYAVVGLFVVTWAGGRRGVAAGADRGAPGAFARSLNAA